MFILHNQISDIAIHYKYILFNNFLEIICAKTSKKLESLLLLSVLAEQATHKKVSLCLYLLVIV